MEIKKRLFSIVLSVVLVFCINPCGQGFATETDSDSQEHISTDGCGGDVYVPDPDNKYSIKESYFKGFKSSVTYTGKDIILKISSKKLKKNQDYLVEYKNNKNVGIATVTIKGMGDYYGTVTKTFKIRPLNINKIKSVEAGKRSLIVNWKKQSTKMMRKHITGYQIKVSTSKNFTKRTTKKVTIKGYKKIAARVKGLKPGKKYYIKMRTFMKVKGNTYYSKWSEVKTKRTVSEIKGDSPSYKTLDEMTQDSDIIVYGKVIGKTCEERSLLIEDEGVEYTEEQLNDKDIVTVSKIKVNEKYKGAMNSAEISVIQLGGKTDKKAELNEDFYNLEEGSSYILFLKKSKKWDNTYWLLNETQSVFAVNEDTMAIESGIKGLTFEWLRG